MPMIREPAGSLAVSLSDVLSQSDAGELELLVLATVAPEGSHTSALAEGLGQSTDAIQEAVARLVQGGLVHANGEVVTLTEAGRLAAATLRNSWPTIASGALSTIDFSEVARFVESWWPVNAERDAAEKAARDKLLAADADRDNAVSLLAEAFSQGRLSSDELDHRTSRTLAARTYGELDDALEGLGGLQRPVKNHPVRKGVFFAIALLSSPFVLLGGMLLLFGSDLGDHVGGLFFLVLLLPGLFALRRWAWPRH